MEKNNYEITEQQFRIFYKHLYRLLESSSDYDKIQYVCKLINPVCNHFNLIIPCDSIFFKLGQ